MRVLRVLTRANGGGPVRHLGSLERELRALGVETRFLIGRCGPQEIDRREELEQAGAEPIVLRGLRPTHAPPDVLVAARALSREIRAFRPDVLHSHTAVAGVVARLAAPPEVAVVHSFHGHTLKGGYWGPLKRRLVRATERGMARRTDVLVCVARQVARELRAEGLRPRHGWSVIAPAPDARPSSMSKTVARAALALPSEAFVLLFAGRLVPVKGLDLLLAALQSPQLRSLRERLVLLVCGTGPQEAELRRLAAPLGEAVRFLGWRSELETPLAAADLGVLPSRNEGWPLFLHDAAWAGLPVIATAVGGTAEALERLGHGHCVSPDSQSALVQALSRAADDGDELRRLGRIGRERVALQPGPVQAAARHQQLYEALLRARKGSSEDETGLAAEEASRLRESRSARLPWSAEP